jgi:ketosteroid isomerase-like protein
MAGGCSQKEEPTKPGEAKPATQIIEMMKKYWNAFNANDLDCVMTFFGDDPVYQPEALICKLFMQ